MKSILLVDDDRGLRQSLADFVDPREYHLASLEDSPGTVDYIKDNSPDVVLLDVNLPSGSGLELLREINKIEDAPPVIVISGFVNAQNAIEAMREGAYEYVTKPFRVEQLLMTINKATGGSALERMNPNPVDSLVSTRVGGADGTRPAVTDHREIIGKSAEIVEIAKMIGQVAKSDAAVLIFGESGTGKELVARAIHRNSARAGQVFLSVNCAALTESLLESELFGHEKGAFTGANARKLGKFELADGGTLFLDEVADTSLATQSKLLRVLQEQEFERVGGEETIRVNVRVIAATNKSLVSCIKEESFRVDLFYRLKVVSIYMPSLRERKDDIALLADHFLKTYSAATGKNIKGISKEAMQLLMEHPWPGNVRELENNIHTAVVMCRNDILQVDDIPIARDVNEPIKVDFEELKDNYYKMFHRVLDPIFGKIYTNSHGQIYHHVQEAIERATIDLTLKQLDGNQVKAARALGISRNTLRDRIDRYSLQ
jgi:DNA-binding NtrC family response regulator